MIDLSIIIITYNSENQIGLLLDSISQDKGELNLEVVVVDNQSSDDSLKVAKHHKIKPLCLQTGANFGYSFAVNKGIAAATGNFYFIMNPDTVVQKGSLKKLLNFAKDTSPLGAVAPRLLNPDGKPQASVFKFPTILNALRKDFLNCKNCFGKYLPSNRVQMVDVAVMAAFLIPKTTYNTVGGLDEKYFLYYEDVDYCRRLKKHHLPVYYLPSAKVRHIHGASGHFASHRESPLLASAKLYYGEFYSDVLNLVLWVGHKWQVILRRKRFRD